MDSTYKLGDWHIENIITACLLTKENEFNLPLLINYKNFKIKDGLLEKKELLVDKFRILTEPQMLIEVLAQEFQCQLFYKCARNEHFISNNYGPSTFIMQTYYAYNFHTNPGKLFWLPRCLHWKKNTLFRVSDIFDLSKSIHSDYLSKNNTLRLCDKIDDFEQKLNVGLEIWYRSRIDGKLKVELKRKTNLSNKKLFHMHSGFNILFLITDTQMYFKGHVRTLKTAYKIK